MAKTVTISDDIAALIEERRRATGADSVDAAAETLIARGLSADAEDDDGGWTIDELRAAIRAGEESGPAEPWDPASVRAEVLRRYHARR